MATVGKAVLPTYLLTRGPGALSLDYLIARRYKTPPVA